MKFQEIRKKWEIEPDTKVHGERKLNNSSNRQKINQNLNKFTGNLNNIDLDQIEEDEWDDRRK